MPRLGATSSDFNECFYVKTNYASIESSTSDQSAVGTGTGSLSIASSFWSVGTTFGFYGNGSYITDALPTKIQFKLYLDAVSLGDTGTAVVLAGNNNWFETHGIFTCLSTGSSGTIAGQMVAMFWDAIAGLLVTARNVNLAPITINTTISHTLDLKVDFDVTSPDYSIVLDTLYFYRIN